MADTQARLTAGLFFAAILSAIFGVTRPSRAMAEPIRPKLASGSSISRKYWLVMVTTIRSTWS